MNINNLEEKLGYTFKNKSLLRNALTHPSTYGRNKNHIFERLEFLGDRVLGLVIAEKLYEQFPKESEGDLAKRLAVLVSRETCYQIASKIGLDEFLVTHEQQLQNRHTSTLANATESLIGAIYLDNGLTPCQAFISRWWQELLLVAQTPPMDPKTILQEYVQKKGMPIPIYNLIKTSGPDHNPVFTVEVSIPNNPPQIGTGNSKKQAEQEAANALISFIRNLR